MVLRSRYTLAEPWEDGGGLLVNTLTGAVDMVSDTLASTIASTADYDPEKMGTARDFLLERGYYVEDAAVEDVFARATARNSLRLGQRLAEPKYMFFTTLRCNLSCSYCWQVQEHGGARQRSPIISEEMIDAAYHFIDLDMARRGATTGVVSLFGGEPLIDRPEYRRTVHAICDRAVAKGLKPHFTTNGKHLPAYRDEVALYHPSIQVTVDGFGDSDRPVLKRAGQRLPGLHEELVWLGRELGTRIFIRFLVALETIEQFIRYADFLFASRIPPSLSLGVAPIQNKSGAKGTKVPAKHEILAALLESLRGRDYARQLAFTDWRSLYLLNYLRTGEPLLPRASFYHCEAQTHLFAFGSDGLLYTCYEAGGDSSLAVGRYFTPEGSAADGTDQGGGSNTEQRHDCACHQPGSDAETGCGGGCSASGHGSAGRGPVPITLMPRRPADRAGASAEDHCPAGAADVDQTHLRRFRERTAFSMPQCSVCSVSPICGGGCQVRGIKKNGVYEFPYCDDLHEEVRFIMKNWPMLADMLLPAQWRAGI